MARSRLLCLLVLLAFAVPAPAGAEPVAVREVQNPVAELGATTQGSHNADKIYCDGQAPVQFLCTGSFVLTGNFSIFVAVANTFWGSIRIRGDTPTGSVTIYCEQMTAPLDCWWEHDGFFMEGQVFTLKGLVTGTGYWRIRVR